MAGNPYEDAGLQYYNRSSRRKRKWEWGGGDDKDIITADEDAKQIEANRNLVKMALDKQRQEQEDAKQEVRKQAEDRARAKTEPGWFERNVVDIFSPNSDADRKRRQEAGQPEFFGDQKKQKEQTAKDFKQDTADEFARGKTFGFSKEEVEARRATYKRRGVDIDQFLQDKNEYERFIRNTKGQSLSKLTREGKIPEGAKRYERTIKQAQRVEDDYQRSKAVEAGAQGGLAQAERGFARGLAEPLVNLPANLQAATGVIGEALTPSGSEMGKVAKQNREAAELKKDSLAQRFVDTGYGVSENDNKLISGIAGGAGSLAASIVAAGAGGTTAAGALFGLTAGADQALAAKEAGKGDIQTAVTGLVAGGAEAALEKFGLDKFLGAKGTVVKKTATRMVAEGVQEASQSLAQSGVEATYTDVDLQQVIQKALTEGGLGAIVGGGAGLPLSIAEDLQARGVPQDAALEVGMNVQNRMELVAAEAKGAPGEINTNVPDGVDSDVTPGQTSENTTVAGAKGNDTAIKTSTEPGNIPTTTTEGIPGSAIQTTTTTPKPTDNNVGKPQRQQPKIKKAAKVEELPEDLRGIGYANTDEFVTDYADMLYGMDKTAKGGIKQYDENGDVTGRTSEHSPFFREFYKANKKAPTKADYIEYATQELDQGRGAYGASDDYKRLRDFEAGTKPKQPKDAALLAPDRPATTTWRQRMESTKQKTTNDREEAFDALHQLESVNEGRKSERSAGELLKLADLLNKAGQSNALLRRGQLKSKKALGVFQPKGEAKRDPVLKLQDKVIEDPRMYATVLAHEMSHSIEFKLMGNNKNTLGMFGELTDTEKTQITNELKSIVDELEGASVAQSNPKYYYKPTEMLARYVETLVLHPGKANLIAPTLSDKFGELVVREPMVAEFMMAIEGSLDKGFKNYTPDFLKDLRQIYRKHLGKQAGDRAYDAEMVRRAEVQRSEMLIADLIKRKFKGIKDEPVQLFRAAEAVLITENGIPKFGTHDFAHVKQEDLSKHLKAGWKVENEILVGENSKGSIFEYDLSRQRYTPEQAEQIFNELSPEGQQLIKDFTAAKEEAKDEFNRELMKQLYNIDSKIEGWVHHFFEGTPMGGNKNVSLKTKVAAAKKQRTGKEGYIEDFQKATEKALLELDRADINNQFIKEQLARISKPIAKGAKPDPGWVEVVADAKGGLRLPGEGGVTILQTEDNKSFKLPDKRYQVPRELVEHYRNLRDLPREVNKAALYLNRVGKYWTINVLTHPGSTSTNFLSGAVQYGSKIVNDFYLDLLTANFSMSRTTGNLTAPIKALTPRGWHNAPDWLYGGYRSTLHGQLGDSSETYTKFDKGLDAYGDKALRVFSLVETYWKKTIALSEDSKLSAAAKRRIIDRLHEDEKRMVVELNKTIDTYAFDYDNKPLWMTNFDRKGGKLLKPFMTYPYKLSKHYTSYVASAFDQTLPWQQRVAKVMTFSTIVAFIAMAYEEQEDKMTTPKGTEDTPLSLRPGGRLFIGSQGAQELFVRTAKYPWFNLTNLGQAAVDRNGQEVLDLLNEQVGTIGPAAEMFMLATGRRDQFNQYTPASVILGEQAATFIPGFRIAKDIGDMLDDSKRKPETFVQGIGANLPIWGSEETRAKLRGDSRSIRIPDETKDPRSISGSARTNTTRGVETNQGDVLLSLLTGVYIRRINPEEAKRQELREIRDNAEEKIRDLLKQGNEADADAMGAEYGLIIPEPVKRYYRNQRKKK